jgi:hypothetical protein
VFAASPLESETTNCPGAEPLDPNITKASVIVALEPLLILIIALRATTEFETIVSLVNVGFD